MKNSNTLPDTLITADISASTLTVLSGLLLNLFCGTKDNPVPEKFDTPEGRALAENFHKMAFQTILDHGLDPRNDEHIPVAFEVPFYVVTMLSALFRRMRGNAGQPWVEEICEAWKPFAEEAIKVAVEWNENRKDFEASWAAGEK